MLKSWVKNCTKEHPNLTRDTMIMICVIFKLICVATIAISSKRGQHAEPHFRGGGECIAAKRPAVDALRRHKKMSRRVHKVAKIEACMATMFTLGSWPFNLSFDVSIAMVPVVDLLLCSLASSHYFLVISNIVSCYGRRQLTWVNPPRLKTTRQISSYWAGIPRGSLIHKLVPSFHYVISKF